MKTALYLALVATAAQGATVTFSNPETGDYRIVSVDDIESSDGYLYSVHPQTITYEQFQQVHYFGHPLDVMLGFIAAVYNQQIPIEQVTIHPEPIYWIENPWTERYDATYHTPFLLQCGTTCHPDLQSVLSLGDIEYNELGASLGDSWTIPYPFAVVTRHVPGDFNGNGNLDPGDIDSLTQAVASGAASQEFDVTGEGLVDHEDIRYWVKQLLSSWYGDANLDRHFDSTDLIGVLSQGTYETGLAAVWSSGDFDGDGRADSSDFIVALADGGYQASLPAIPVPEPASLILALLGVLSLLRGFRLSI